MMFQNQKKLILFVLVVAALPSLSMAFTSMAAVGRSPSLLFAGGNVIELHDGNFNSLLKGDKPILIDCMAQWCGKRTSSEAPI